MNKLIGYYRAYTDALVYRVILFSICIIGFYAFSVSIKTLLFSGFVAMKPQDWYGLLICPPVCIVLLSLALQRIVINGGILIIYTIFFIKIEIARYQVKNYSMSASLSYRGNLFTITKVNGRVFRFFISSHECRDMLIRFLSVQA